MRNSYAHRLTMTYPANGFANASCPSDLCAFNECHCSPSESYRLGRLPLRIIGGAALGLALIGVGLPLLPTTPFLLVAAWAFARSSPRLEDWLHGHPVLGPPLMAWKSRRAIPGKAKVLAGVSLPASWSLLWLGGASGSVLAGCAIIMLAVGSWILSRPS